jgi:hypothetical protein
MAKTTDHDPVTWVVSAGVQACLGAGGFEELDGVAGGVVDHDLLCTYRSAAVLVGLVLNAALGWWWADPVAGLGDRWAGLGVSGRASEGVAHRVHHVPFASLGAQDHPEGELPGPGGGWACWLNWPVHAARAPESPIRYTVKIEPAAMTNAITASATETPRPPHKATAPEPLLPAERVRVVPGPPPTATAVDCRRARAASRFRPRTASATIVSAIAHGSIVSPNAVWVRTSADELTRRSSHSPRQWPTAR